MVPLRQELLRIGLLLLAGLVGGAIIGTYALGLIIATLAWIVLQGREFRRLGRWSERPLARPDNVSELWQGPTERLFRSLKAARGRSRELIVQLRRFKRATDALPDGAVLMTPSGVIEEFNHAARELLGLAATDRGQVLTSLVRHPDLAALVNGEVDDQLVEIASPVDDQQRLEIRRIAVDERQVLILARDVTQLNRLLTMRQDFIANVSHELRTPLTVITGYLEALQDTSLDASTMRELLAKLHPPAGRMRALVDDLLLLTRLESSPPLAADQVRDVDVPGLLRQIVADAEQLSAGRHRFATRLESHLEVRGIETELHSAFANLVTNAVRYSPHGGTITISWTAHADGACFEVADEGLGIAREHLSRITERFYRIDLAGARVRGGTGLGLAIVKHVLKRHGTELKVQSELGKGSRFFCVFPPSAVCSVSDTAPLDTETSPTTRT